MVTSVISLKKRQFLLILTRCYIIQMLKQTPFSPFLKYEVHRFPCISASLNTDKRMQLNFTKSKETLGFSKKYHPSGLQHYQELHSGMFNGFLSNWNTYSETVLPRISSSLFYSYYFTKGKKEYYFNYGSNKFCVWIRGYHRLLRHLLLWKECLAGIFVHVRRLQEIKCNIAEGNL